MRSGYSFRVEVRDPGSRGRVGRLATPRGSVETPAFLPVGTAATVKAARPADLEGVGVPMILCNTYHLALRPGVEVIRRAGGLHAFMGWSRPILTDSGGFQVFSLSPFREVSDDEVRFRSHLDGAMLRIGPAEAIRIQQDLGADLILPLDVCTPNPCPRDEAADAVRRTGLWAERSLDAHGSNGAAIFGIVQGGTYPDLREEAADRITALPFDGFAVGGLSVGEGREAMTSVLRALRLPDERPRHLLGVGMPEDILLAVEEGIDTFDCVVPTRNARGAGAFTFAGRIHLRNRRFAEDFGPLEAGCPCPVCARFSRAYLRHLHLAREILASILGTIHNLAFFQRFTAAIRRSIREGRFPEFRDDFLAGYASPGSPAPGGRAS